MVKFLVISKSGKIKTVNTTKSFDLSNLYKKCGLKNDNCFDARSTWGWNGKHIILYAANDGRAGQENKYELPPPVDTHIFFGGMALICIDGDEISEENLSNFTEKNWKQLYEKLLGGFEDLDDDSEFDEDDEDIDEDDLTKDGYYKDGFVVDSDEENEDEDDDEDASDYDEEADSDYVPDSDELKEEDYELSENGEDEGEGDNAGEKEASTIVNDNEGEGEGEGEGEAVEEPKNEKIAD
tara:strand:+ start:4258 stop:4974 length:717 start_codon:yes stop_codon:yes gene_type:complete